MLDIYVTLLSSVQFSSVAQSCLILCDPMNHSMPGLPVHHQLLEFTQTHVHRVGDTIQPSHPLSSPSPPAPNPSQHQSLFQWVNSSFCLQCRRSRFDPWVGKIPWRRERLPTPVFWPGELHGLYSPWGCKESDMTEQLSLSLLNISQRENLLF